MNETEQKLDKYVGHLAEGAMRFRNELFVGTESPDFELPSLDGDLVRLSEFRGKSNVVLIFGSFTCGSTVTQLRAGKPPLGSLYRRFKQKGFEFFLVYSVELHPGENVPRPATFEQRLLHARLREGQGQESDGADVLLGKTCRSDAQRQDQRSSPQTRRPTGGENVSGSETERGDKGVTGRLGVLLPRQRLGAIYN